MNTKIYEKRFSEYAAFWLAYLVVMSFAHVVVYMRIRELSCANVITIPWIVLNVVMALVSFLTRSSLFTEGKQRKWTDRVGGVWFVFVFILFCLIAAQNVIFYAFGVTYDKGVLTLLSFALSALLVAFGVVQASTVCVTRLELKTQKLQTRSRLRIVQITDIHLGPWAGMELLKQTVEKINNEKPDIVVVTGDLADGKVSGYTKEAAVLAAIKAPLGVFAVTGNHEYYDDIDDSIAFMKMAGMKVLRNEAVYAGDIIIAGADDRGHLAKKRWNLSKSEMLVLSLAKEQKKKFLLLLRHRPIIEHGTRGHFDLQLSGHTHGGQIIPAPNSRHIIAGRSRGLKKLKSGGYIYVSNGAGYVGPPVRIFAPPEIVVVDIYKDDMT